MQAVSFEELPYLQTYRSATDPKDDLSCRGIVMGVFKIVGFALVLLLCHPAFLRGVDSQTVWFIFPSEDSKFPEKPQLFFCPLMLSFVFAVLYNY